AVLRERELFAVVLAAVVRPLVDDLERCRRALVGDPIGIGADADGPAGARDHRPTDPGAAAGAEGGLDTVDVDPGHLDGVGAVTRDLARAVQHRRAAGRGRLDAVAVEHVAAGQRGPGPGDPPGGLRVGIADQRDHLAAVLAQQRDHVLAEKTGRSRDQNFRVLAHKSNARWNTWRRPGSLVLILPAMNSAIDGV